MKRKITDEMEMVILSILMALGGFLFFYHAEFLFNIIKYIVLMIALFIILVMVAWFGLCLAKGVCGWYRYFRRGVKK